MSMWHINKKGAFADFLMEVNLFEKSMVDIAWLTPAWAKAVSEAPRIVVDGRELEISPAPLIIKNRVFAGLRALVEALGADIAWDADNQTVVISRPYRQGERYLQGLSGETPGNPDARRNLINAAALRDLLDDDRDGDLADYRAGYSGGDTIANDPSSGRLACPVALRFRAYSLCRLGCRSF